jgi:hypothetical protein
MAWLEEFKISDVFSGVWEDVKNILTPPKWTKEISLADFFRGVKEDFVKGTKSVGEGLKGLLKGVRDILTPTVIWIIVIAIVALIIWTQFQKTLKT